MSAASAKPWRRNTSITAPATAAAHETSRPPLVCGSVRSAQLALLQRGRQHTHAERLAEDEPVAGARIRIALDALRMHEPERDEAVDRLDRIDRVAARDRDAGRAAHRLAAVEDARDRLR